MYEAFFFGPEDLQLFGVYHPPIGSEQRVLTLICPPLFSELNRSHGSLRKLAITLANAGHHVLRFDYVGTGDSFGDLDELAFADWEESIAIALQEGRELSGCDKVRILGVRGSCPLVCRSVGDDPAVERFVFWDPILDGQQYLENLRQGQIDAIEHHVHMSRADRDRIERSYCVYQMSKSMENDFRALTADTYASIPGDKLSVVKTTIDDDLPENTGRSEVVEFDCEWGVESEEVIMCQPVLETLLTYLHK